MSATVTVSGGANVGNPRDDDPEGVLKQMEDMANAQAVDIEITLSQQLESQRLLIGEQEEARIEAAAEEAEATSKGAYDPGGAEAAVYGDMATEALGGTAFKLLKTARDLMTDQDPGTFSVGGKKVNTFEDIIKGANGKPGVNTDGGSLRDSFPIADRANNIGNFMNDPGRPGTWAVAQVDMPSVRMALEQTASLRPAAENVLGQIQRVREMQGPARGMAPGHDLSSGPRYVRPKEEGLDNEGRGGSGDTTSTAMA